MLHKHLAIYSSSISRYGIKDLNELFWKLESLGSSYEVYHY